MFKALLGITSAYDNSQYMQWQGWTNPKYEHAKNTTYRMVTSIDDCDRYTEVKRSSWTYVEPTEKHEYTTIFLHGVGGTSPFFKPDFIKGGHAYAANQRAVLPQAHKMKYVSTMKKAGPMNSWFDFWAWKNTLTKPALFDKMAANRDWSGRAVYLSSSIN
jgi:hypothetical protein